MSKILPIYTALPFFRVDGTYSLTSPNKPFYFQKDQCVRDCNYGTITDRQSLPSFIIRVPKTPIQYSIDFTTDIKMEVLCADGSNVEILTPNYHWEVKAFATSAEVTGPIQAQVPVLGDKYYVDDGFGDVEIWQWSGAVWLQSGQVVPIDGYLMNVEDEGFVYQFVYKDNGNNNVARNGFWKKTLNGFQVCDIGDETLLIYNGFKVKSDLPFNEMSCGYRQVRISFLDQVDSVFTPIYLSELIDVRDFNPANNTLHRLNITNTCALGNIPYEDINLKHLYYFDENAGEGLVGEPEYAVRDTKEEDGLGNELLLFSRINKFFQLDTLSVPEYIVDFLMFATQHDIVSITFPLEKSNNLTLNSQYQGEREIDNDNFTATNDWIDTGCYATVNLKFSLVDDVIKTGCCQQLDKDACIECGDIVIEAACPDQKDLIESAPPSIGDKILILPMSSPGCVVCDIDCNEWYDNPNALATWNGVGWDYETPVLDRCVTIFNSGFGVTEQWFYHEIYGWQIVGAMFSFIPNQYQIDFKGAIYQGVSGYVYYRKLGEFTWNLWSIETALSLSAGISVTGLAPCTTYQFQILLLSNNCDYGRGPIYKATTLADFTC